MSDVREIVAAIHYVNIDGINYEGAYLAKAVIKALESIGIDLIARIPDSERYEFIQDTIIGVIIYFQMNIGYDGIAYPLCLWFLHELHKLDQLCMIKEAIEQSNSILANEIQLAKRFKDTRRIVKFSKNM